MRCQLCNKKIEEEGKSRAQIGFCNKCRDRIIKNLEKEE